MAVVSLFHFVQLTEGRYARDIPKQLPIKKNEFAVVLGVGLGFLCLLFLASTRSGFIFLN